MTQKKWKFFKNALSEIRKSPGPAASRVSISPFPDENALLEKRDTFDIFFGTTENSK